jgi:hypothetical protein
VLGINGFAIAAYILASSSIWIDPRLPAEARTEVAGSFIWFMLAFPILALAFLFDLGWLGWRVFRGFRGMGWSFWMPLAALIAGWSLAHIINGVMMPPA